MTTLKKLLGVVLCLPAIFVYSLFVIATVKGFIKYDYEFFITFIKLFGWIAFTSTLFFIGMNFLTGEK